MEIGIIDYGAGNAVNVKNALEKLGFSAQISAESKNWEGADALIFPGVGSFGAAMGNLGERADSIREIIGGEGVPFLGICLGMQLLMEGSEESPGVGGLGALKGEVKRFGEGLPVPHMGWNRVEPAGECPLFGGIGGMYAYFVHSYYCVPEDGGAVAARTGYGAEFASALWKKNIFATQFHPEKSGEKGLALLENFVKEARK
jgi:glutamine amidotransferase